MNKRQKLKRLKIQLKNNLNPGKVALVTFPLNDKYLDVSTALDYMMAIAKHFPEVTWLAMPNKMSFTVEDKELIQAYIDKCQETLNQLGNR